MGWTGTHRPAGMTTLEFFQGEFPTLFATHDVLAHNTDREGFYAAMRERDTGKVWALVVGVQRTPGSHFNYSYKECSETMGPGWTGASRAVLDALTPTDHQWANEWRAEVRARLDKPQAKVGDTIRFARPITFTSGAELDTFIVAQRDKWTRAGVRKETILASVNGGYYKVSDWKHREFTVLAPATVSQEA